MKERAREISKQEIEIIYWRERLHKSQGRKIDTIPKKSVQLKGGFCTTFNELYNNNKYSFIQQEEQHENRGRGSAQIAVQFHMAYAQKSRNFGHKFLGMENEADRTTGAFNAWHDFRDNWYL